MSGDVRYGGFWIRIVANALDLLILGAVHQALVAMGVGFWVGVTDMTEPMGGGSGNYALMTPLLVIVAVIAFWIWKGATPGKMLCGLRIVDEPTGGPLTVWQGVGRYFMAAIALAVAGIGYLWIAIDPRKQGWHDKIARTLVVRVR